MSLLFRILDANINRASEGLRVLEDRARFIDQDADISGSIRGLRHEIRKTLSHLMSQCLDGRDSLADPGLALSQSNPLDRKHSPADIVNGNFKRVQEALRVIEEHLNLGGYYELAKIYETMRFRSYTLEKTYDRRNRVKKRQNALDTDIYCLTAEKFSKGRSNSEVVAAMIDAGIKIIQYREKEKKSGEKLKECRNIRAMTAEADVTLIVNDDIDLALMVGADGVHVGQEDYPVQQVRDLVGEGMIIGLSTHSPEQAEKAYRDGADYIGVGPIFQTFTKEDVCDPVGFDYLDYAVKHVKIPFVAIGGIKTGNVASICSRGATCVAMVTEIVGAEDIKKKIQQIRRHIKQARENST